LFQDNEEEKPKAKPAETVVVYIILWVVLVVPGGKLVYDLFASPPWTKLGPYGIGMFAYVMWLVIASIFIAPPLTSKLVYMMYPVETSPPRPIRKRVDEFFSDAWDFLKALSHFLRTILLFWWAGYIVPMGVITAIILGGWFYFIPFLAANILIGYKFNKARRTRGAEAYDDKNFTSYEKSLNDYLSLIKKPDNPEERTHSQ
jgi:hypothetical protein